MDETWAEALVAVISGTLGVAALFLVIAPRIRRSEQEFTPAEKTEVAPPAEASVEGWMIPLHRCEQAVRRVERAVDTVSSVSARQALLVVVRRMEAELPSVRALAELGYGLEAGTADRHAIGRVRDQLDDGTARFAMAADHVLEAVFRHVAEPDLSRLHMEVAELRQQFPLLRPMSSVVSPPSAARELADLSA